MKKIYFFSALLCAVLMNLAVFAQQRTVVKGLVTDENNTPLAGVTVSVKGGSKSTATNDNGAYAIEVGGSDDVLVFSFTGAQNKEVRADGKKVINVTLSTTTKQLKDVVVIGYGTANKKDVTGSITTIKSEEFNQGVLTTPAELLQGKVPGLNVTKSGDPNAAPAVVLRGPSTIRT